MNKSSGHHVLQQRFLEIAPQILHNRVGEHIFGISQMVDFLTSLPERPTVFDTYGGLHQKYNLQGFVQGEENIPTNGPLIAAANHPYSFFDQWVLAQIIKTKRPDKQLRIVMDSDATVFQELQHIIEITGETKKEKLSFRKRIDTLLKHDASIIYFPAGKTSYRGIGTGIPIEDDWKSGVTHFSQSNDTPILPVHIDAYTGVLYNMLRNIRERKKVRKWNIKQACRKNQDIKLTIGETIPSNEEITPNELRDLIYALVGKEYKVKKED